MGRQHVLRELHEKDFNPRKGYLVGKNGRLVLDDDTKKQAEASTKSPKEELPTGATKAAGAVEIDLDLSVESLVEGLTDLDGDGDIDLDDLLLWRESLDDEDENESEVVMVETVIPEPVITEEVVEKKKKGGRRPKKTTDDSSSI